MKAASPPLISKFSTLAPGYDVLLCDIWGVVHNGLAVHPHACDALMRARAKGATVVLVTNAPRPSEQVARQLDRLHCPREVYDAIVSSGDVTRSVMQERHGQTVYHLGPERDRSIFGGFEAHFAPLETADYVVCTGLDDDDIETPEDYRARLESMIESRPDWVISRQRAWGVPIAVFVKERPDGSVEILQDPEVELRIIEAFEQEGADAWYKADARERFLGKLANDGWKKVDDILDVWFDSGSTHAFVLEDPKHFPTLAGIKRKMDGGKDTVMYLEGSDQHRGWFHSSLLESCGTRGRAPFDVVLTHGFVLDEQGRKMSKSLGNVTAPQDVIKQSGADILRMAAYIVNHILGGGSFSSRLYKEVREKRGLAYGVSNSLVWFRHAAVVLGGTATRADRTADALAVIEQETKRM